MRFLTRLVVGRSDDVDRIVKPGIRNQRADLFCLQISRPAGDSQRPFGSYRRSARANSISRSMRLFLANRPNEMIDFRNLTAAASRKVEMFAPFSMHAIPFERIELKRSKSDALTAATPAYNLQREPRNRLKPDALEKARHSPCERTRHGSTPRACGRCNGLVQAR